METKAIWDRKSPRHKWQIVCVTNNEGHFKNVLSASIDIVTKVWTNGQVGYTIGEPDSDISGFKPLPANANVTRIL